LRTQRQQITVFLRELCVLCGEKKYYAEQLRKDLLRIKKITIKKAASATRTQARRLSYRYNLNLDALVKSLEMAK